MAGTENTAPSNETPFGINSVQIDLRRVDPLSIRAPCVCVCPLSSGAPPERPPPSGSAIVDVNESGGPLYGKLSNADRGRIPSTGIAFVPDGFDYSEIMVVPSGERGVQCDWIVGGPPMVTIID